MGELQFSVLHFHVALFCSSSVKRNIRNADLFPFHAFPLIYGALSTTIHKEEILTEILGPKLFS